MKLNTANLFNFLLLVSFVYGVRVDSGYNMKQRKIATKPKLRNNWDETPETAITPLITMPGEKIFESELNNLTKHNFKIREKLHTYVNGMGRRKSFYRKIRNAANKISESDNLECLSCFGNGVTKKDEDCYRGISIRTQKCLSGQHCYIELQEDFIKRGCINGNKMNRTFACRCPLCNDKPSDNPIYYNYDKISAWEFHNQYIQKPLPGVELICKICETRGTNVVSDRTCRQGKYADYMVCGYNQICYTNINDENNFVSRGCVNKPIFNSILQICNKTLCNFNSYDNPKISKIDEPHAKKYLSTGLVSKACNNKDIWLIISLAIIQILLNWN